MHWYLQCASRKSTPCVIKSLFACGKVTVPLTLLGRGGGGRGGAGGRVGGVLAGSLHALAADTLVLATEASLCASTKKGVLLGRAVLESAVVALAASLDAEHDATVVTQTSDDGRGGGSSRVRSHCEGCGR